MQLVQHWLAVWPCHREFKHLNELCNQACRLCVVWHLDLLLACAGCVKDLD
jgi:hypothetical protein